MGIGDNCPDFLALLIGGNVPDNVPQDQVVAVIKNCCRVAEPLWGKNQRVSAAVVIDESEDLATIHPALVAKA